VGGQKRRAFAVRFGLAVGVYQTGFGSVRRAVENDGLHWPRRDGLKWPHLESVVVRVDVA